MERSPLSVTELVLFSVILSVFQKALAVLLAATCRNQCLDECKSTASHDTQHTTQSYYPRWGRRVSAGPAPAAKEGAGPLASLELLGWCMLEFVGVDAERLKSRTAMKKQKLT
jgi:hypothetical protein